MELGGFIRKTRMQKKMSMRELSRQSGVTVSYLSNIENNKLGYEPNVEIVFELLKTLGVSEPHKKMAEFGLVENEQFTSEETYDRAKRSRFKREIELLMDGMNAEEMESLFLLLKEHFNILELLSSVKDRKASLDLFETYVEFIQFQEGKKEEKKIIQDPS